MEALNQQLDYAEGAMTSIKEDRQHRHSLFVEYTIVALIFFEVGIELYSLGWFDRIDLIPPPPPEPSPPPPPPLLSTATSPAAALAAAALAAAAASSAAEAGPQPETCLAATALQKGEEATRQQQRQHGTRARVSRKDSRHVV